MAIKLLLLMSLKYNILYHIMIIVKEELVTQSVVFVIENHDPFKLIVVTLSPMFFKIIVCS